MLPAAAAGGPTVSPCCRGIPATVDAAGQGRLECSRSPIAFRFLAPRWGNCERSPTICATTSGDVLCGCERGARDRSARPPQPQALNCPIHSYTVVRLTPKRRASSALL